MVAVRPLAAAAVLLGAAAGASTKRRLACVGDEFGGDYPAALGALLGKAYVVEAFMAPGATGGEGSPWAKHAAAFDAAVAFAPDVAVMTLGHNDAADFKGSGVAMADTFANQIKSGTFRTRYRDQIRAFVHAAPTLATVYVVSPRGAIKNCCGVAAEGLVTVADIVSDDGGFVDDLMRTNEFPDHDLVAVDLHGEWADATGCPTGAACASFYADDGVRPSPAGDDLVAEILRDALARPMPTRWVLRRQPARRDAGRRRYPSAAPLEDDWEREPVVLWDHPGAVFFLSVLLVVFGYWLVVCCTHCCCPRRQFRFKAVEAPPAEIELVDARRRADTEDSDASDGSDVVRGPLRRRSRPDDALLLKTPTRAPPIAAPSSGDPTADYFEQLLVESPGSPSVSGVFFFFHRPLARRRGDSGPLGTARWTRASSGAARPRRA